MLGRISDLLTALSQLLKQEHLLAKDYQSHLLYERLYNGISEDIDRIKEIALACGYSEEIANAQLNLENASKIVVEYPSALALEQEIIKQINATITELNNTVSEIDSIFDQFVAKEGIINMLGDIAEKRTRDIYLLRFGY